MKKITSLSIITSVIIHVIFLSIIAFIKIYTGKGIEDKVFISLIKEKKSTYTRRMLPSRPLLSLSKSPKSELPEQYSFITIQKEYKDFLLSTSGNTLKYAEPIKQIDPELNISTLSFKPKEYIKYEISVSPRKDTIMRATTIKPRIIDGYSIISETPKLPTNQTKLLMFDDILKEYTNSIRNKIESKKRYPIIARNMGIEGRTRLKLIINKDGSLEKVEILETSGYKILDETALQSIHESAPFPPIPAEIKKDRLELKIYLSFEISKNN